MDKKREIAESYLSLDLFDSVHFYKHRNVASHSIKAFDNDYSDVTRENNRLLTIFAFECCLTMTFDFSADRTNSLAFPIPEFSHWKE